MDWEPIESLPEGVMALLWTPCDANGEARIFVDRYFIAKRLVEEVESECRNAAGRRRIIQERTVTDRQWMDDGWSATHWMPLPKPPTNQ